MSCAFCDLPEIKERTIAKNKTAWSFPTNIPIVPGHTLICPKRHVSTFQELTAAEIEDIFKLCKKLKKALVKCFSAEGFNYAWNEGEIAGQSVPHLHFHILPRKAGDAGITKYEPRKFLYRPGSRKTKPEQELKEVSELIKKNL